MVLATKAESRYALTCTICFCVLHLVTHAYVLSKTLPKRTVNLNRTRQDSSAEKKKEKQQQKEHTILRRCLFAKLLHRPLLIAPSHHLNERDLIREIEVLTLSEPLDRVDDEEGLVAVAARERMGALHVPVHIVHDVGEEGGEIAADEIAEDLGDVGLGRVGAVCRGRCHGAGEEGDEGEEHGGGAVGRYWSHGGEMRLSVLS